MTIRHRPVPRFPLALALVAAMGFAATLVAQDRLKSMPGYEQYQKMSQGGDRARSSPAPSSVTWKDGGKTFEYAKDGKMYRFDVATKAATETGPAPEPQAARGPWRARRHAGGRAGPAGWRPTTSPDEKLKAFYRDRNLWVSDADGANEVPVTTDGSEKDRIKYGTASWVYGEELGQTTAMWWSPDSTQARLLPLRREAGAGLLPAARTRRSSTATVDIEAYPKAGRAESDRRPVRLRRRREEDARRSTSATASRSTTTSSATTSTACRWSPDGKELLFNRTNRRQNILEFVGGQPGDRRVPRHRPRGVADRLGRELARRMTFLQGRQALHLGVGAQRLAATSTSTTSAGKLHRAAHEATRRSRSASLVKVDEDAKVVFYMARDGDNYLKLQLHRVGLDGKGDVRLTDPAFNHTVGSCMARRGGRGGGAAGRPGGRRLRHLAGQQVLRRRLPDARHAAGDAARRRRHRQGRSRSWRRAT